MSKLFSQANLQKIVAKLGMPGIVSGTHTYITETEVSAQISAILPICRR